MKLEKFWQIIDEVRAEGEDDEAHAEALQARLTRLKPHAIVDFQRHFDALHAELYDWDLWAAAYVIQGGCSDDGFADFRSWVISAGKRVHKLARNSPDALAELELDDDAGSRLEQTTRELFSYAADEAYEGKTGESLPLDSSLQPEDPTGSDWDEDDLPRRMPRLWAKYGAE